MKILNKKLSFLMIFTFLSVFVFSQTKDISGVVKDETGEPLPGVNVLVKGTTNGTSTDFDGNYTISASKGDVLEFSFIGYANSTKVVGNSSKISIALNPDAKALDEVVVTALGVSREKKALGYAVQEVSGEDLTSSKNGNAISALSGKVAGVNINSPSGNLGGSQRIIIRGISSLKGENKPLFVVDGIAMDNSNFNTANAQRGAGGVDYGSTINDLNPDDIESVSVLKGSAAAIYGSRASNGVILITTKKGKLSDGKIDVTINSSITLSSVDVLPDLQRQYGGGATISKKNGGVKGFNTATINGKEYLVADYATDESWGPKFDPKTKVLQWDAFDKESFPNDYLKPRSWIAPKNDVRDFFKTGITRSNSITISTGNEKGRYLFNLGGSSASGTVPNTSIKKYNVKASIMHNISDKLSANIILNYVNTKGQRPVIGYDGNSITQKFFQWGQRQLDYKRLKNYKNKNGTQRAWNRISWDNNTPNYSDNPYWTLNENTPKDERNKLFGKIGATYKINDNLSVNASVNADTYTFKNSKQIAIGSQDTPYYQEKSYDLKDFNYEFTSNYNKTISDNFGLTAMAGLNFRRYKLDYRYNATTGGLSLPGIYSINNGIGELDKNSSTSKKNVNSVFGSLGFSFFNQLYLDLTARNDWSSALPDDNNSYFYPSASLAWNFNNTLFSDASWFNLGKLRLGWSQVGNDTDPYNAATTLLTDNPFKGTGRATVPSRLSNADLKSETTTAWEIGTELVFFDRRLSIDATYYRKSTTDQIIPIDLSFGTGFGSNYVNVGEIINKGFELQLGIVPIRNKNFTWDIDFNFAKNENELSELTGGLTALNIGNAPFRAQLVSNVGQPYGSIMGTDFVYDDKGNKVVGENGLYASTDKLVNLGSILQDYTAGLRNSFNYKNIDFSFLIGVKKGGKYFSTTHQWGMYSGMLAETAANNIREKGIVLPGVVKHEKTVPVIVNGKQQNKTVVTYTKNKKNISAQDYGNGFYGGTGTPDAQNVFDADYIKLKEVSLGYTFKGELFKLFKNAKISLFGRNLLTWGLDYDGIDPETVSTGSGNIQGLEGGLQPSVRSYGVNVKLSF